MKKLLQISKTTIAVLLILVQYNLYAQNVSTPRDVSQAAELKQTIGLTDLTVNYSRPGVVDRNGKDRTGKIWGSLVPFGFNVEGFGNGKPIPWRAGANENTTFTCSDDIKIEGKTLNAGTYGLHIAVNENNTATIIFSKNHTSWGSYFYEDSEDALRADIKTETVAFTNILTFNFIDLKPNGATLVLDWEKKRFPVKIDIDVNNIVVNNMKNQLRSTAGFSWQGYMSAAQYCVNNNTNLDDALVWIDRSIAMNKNAQNLTVKSQLQLKKGDKAGSEKTIDEVAAIADINQLNTVGYQLINAGNIDKAIKMFELNVKRNPKDANCYDSLGEAYRAKGDDEAAIKNFRKSLSLDPPENVKTNSIKNLKEMGEKI